MTTKNYSWSALLIILFLSTTIVRSQETPFNCDFNAYLFQNNDVFALDLASGNSYEVATDVTPGNINATGYNPTDGFIWGSLSSPAKTIVRIGNNFETTSFTFDELPTSNRYVGDVSSNGIYYLKQGGSGYHKIDLNPSSPNYGTYLGAGTMSKNLSIHDWAFNAVDGFLYTVEKNSNKLYRINAENGQVEDLGVVPILTGFNYTYGAVYFDASGRFYVSANQTGTIFVIQAVQNLNSGSSMQSNLFAYGPSSSSNDGARCPTAPVPQEICDNGIDDDGDGLIDCDDPSCSGVESCPVLAPSGGNEGGLESNNRLAQKISNRNFNRSKSGFRFDAKKANPFLKSASYGQQNRNSIIELSDLVPMDVIEQATVIESTPNDLISITNATEVLSIDYSRNDERLAAMLILKTENGVYEHTKYICDRLLGAELISVSTLEINGERFIKSIIKNPDGQMEFVVSFSARVSAEEDRFEIESHWNLDRYQDNATFYNFQIWTNSLEDLVKLSEEALRLLEIQKPITAYESSTPPTVFVKKGAYINGALELQVVNTNGSETLFFEGGLSKTETSTTEIVTTEKTLDGSYISTHVVDMGSLFDIGFRISNGKGDTPDDVFLSDGPWGVDDFAATTSIQSFEVTPQEANNSEGLRIERNVSLKSTTSEYVSVYRAFTPKFQEVDLSEFNSLEFDASGTGNMEIRLIKKSITDWNNQLKAQIELSNETEHYVVSYKDFYSQIGETIDLTDVTTIVFTLSSENQTTQTKELTLANLVFKQNDELLFTVNEENAVVISPNPVKSNAVISFYSDKQTEMNLVVFDMLGKAVLRETFFASKGANSHPLKSEFLQKGVYVYQLQSSDIQYKSGKLIKGSDK